MTLNEIVDDILLTCSYMDKDKAEPVHRRQVEAWIHHYRMLLIKQDVNDNSVIDPTYVTYQNMFFKKDNPSVVAGRNKYISIYPIPKLPVLLGRFAITSIINSITGEIVPMVDVSEHIYPGVNFYNRQVLLAGIKGQSAYLTKFGKELNEIIFTQQERANLGIGRNEHIYLYVSVGMVLANPEDFYPNEENDFREKEYPLAEDKIGRLKQLIFANELQWLMPPQATAQSSQQAKLEEKDITNNPAAMLQAGGQLYEGID